MSEKEAIEFLYDLLSITDYKMKHKEAVEYVENELERLRNNERILMLYVREGSLKEVHEAMLKYKGGEQNDKEK